MTFFIGFGVGLSLIVAIGAQNIWVLSQSMVGANRLVIATVCILCDCILIAIGIFAIKYVQHLIPPLVPILSWMGVALLIWLSWQALQRVFAGGSGLTINKQSQPLSSSKTAITALAITLLNPHVYLDTVFLIGSVGNQQDSPLWFMVGAWCASLLWFSALTALAPTLKVWLNSAKRWQLFDGTIALTLGTIAISMAIDASQR